MADSIYNRIQSNQRVKLHKGGRTARSGMSIKIIHNTSKPDFVITPFVKVDKQLCRFEARIDVVPTAPVTITIYDADTDIVSARTVAAHEAPVVMRFDAGDQTLCLSCKSTQNYSIGAISIDKVLIIEHSFARSVAVDRIVDASYNKQLSMLFDTAIDVDTIDLREHRAHMNDMDDRLNVLRESIKCRVDDGNRLRARLIDLAHRQRPMKALATHIAQIDLMCALHARFRKQRLIAEYYVMDNGVHDEFADLFHKYLHRLDREMLKQHVIIDTLNAKLHADYEFNALQHDIGEQINTLTAQHERIVHLYNEDVAALRDLQQQREATLVDQFARLHEQVQQAV